MTDPYQCPFCLADPMPFSNPDRAKRKCAFDASGAFTPNNWNCGGIEALHVQIQGGVIYGSDESMTLVPAVPGEYGGWLVLTRYKRRGKCSSAVHVGDFWPSVPVTLDHINAALGRPRYRLVNTDNRGGDYPDECFTPDGPYDTKATAETRCAELNAPLGDWDSRYYKVEALPYTLVTGFEP